MATATSPTAANLGVDWSNRHAIDMARIEAGQVANVQALLGKLETKLAATLMDSGIAPGKAAKLQAIHKAAADAIGATYGAIAEQQELALGEVAGMEAKAAGKLLNAQVGADIFGPVLTEKQWSKVANETLIFGHSSGAWWKSQDEALRFKFQGAMQEGYALGESVDEMVRRLRGTKANGYKDGIMSASRREAEALVRSSVQTISNAARLAGFEEQSDIIKGVAWVSTLDGRTTPICQALNGLTWRLPDYEPIKHTKIFPGPTAHWNCRSTQVAVLRSWAELSGKPIKALDGATLQAKLQAKLAAKGMDPQQVAAATARSQASMDGQVPASLDFQTWLQGKPDAFALELLGPGRFAMWKAGKITTRDLTDQNNRPLTIAQLQAAIDGDGFPVETEGIEYLPPEQPTPKYVAEAIQTAADLQAAEAAATAKIADILANPKGQTLKAAALSKLQKEQPDLTPSDMLAMAEGIAAEKQAAASKASVLSQAKKKLVNGETPTPAQWKLLNDLPEDEKNAFLASVEEGKKANAAGIYAELDALIDATGGKLSASEIEKLNLLPAEQVNYLNGKIIAAEQDATKAELKAKFANLNELNADPAAAAKFAALPPVLKGEVADHLYAKHEAKQAADQIAAWESGTDPLKQQAMKQAKDAAKGLTLPPTAIAQQAEINLVNLEWDALAQAVAGPNATKLKQAAFQKTTGLKPDFSDLESFKEWMIDNVEPMEAGQILDTVTTEAAAKQAAASKASKLSTAKAKILAGKAPTPSEQAVIDSLTPEEKTSWQESVKQAQTLQAAPVVGLKVQIEETTLDSKKGLAALKKQPQIEGSQYEDFLDYLEPDELAKHKVNALPIVEYTPEWEAGETATLMGDSDLAKLPNQVTKIPLADAISNQVYIRTPDVEHYLKTGKTDSSNPAHLGKPPLVVKLDGKYQVHDGNHRANAYLLAGETELPALVYDLDAAIATDPKNPAVQKIFGGDPPADIVAKAKAAYAKSIPAGTTPATSADEGLAWLESLYNTPNPPEPPPAATALVNGKAVMQTSKALWGAKADPALVETIKAKLGFDPTVGAANIGEVNAGLAGWAKSSGKDLGALLAEAKAEVKAAAKQASKTATATKPDVKAANLDLFIPDPSDLVKVKDLSGSTRPILAKDPTTGKQWVVKSPEQGGGGPEHLRNEAAADAIYRIAGVPVPGSAYVEQDGKHYKVAEFLEGAKTLGEWERTASPAEREAAYGKIREHFVMDALMGNWDVAGQSNDNIMVMPDGTPVRVDNGGALDWRAMGKKKTASEWKATVDELKTLRDPATAAGKTAQIFAGLTPDDINSQIAAIVGKRDDLVAAVRERKGDAVADTFAKRIAYLEKQLPAAMRKVKPTVKGATPNQIPPDLEKRLQVGVRGAGTSIKAGTDEFEDQIMKVWKETTPDGTPVTKLEADLTFAGNDKLLKIVQQHGVDTKALGTSAYQAVATQPDKHPADEYWDKFLAAAKTVSAHAEDGQYNTGTLATYEQAKGEILALYSTPGTDAGKKAMLKHYLDAAAKIDAAKAASAKLKAGELEYYKVPPAPATAAKPVTPAADGWQVSRYDNFRWTVKEVQGGRLVDTDRQNDANGLPLIANHGRSFRMQKGGVEITFMAYREDSSNTAELRNLQGTLRITVKSDDSPAAVEAAIKSLRELGLEAGAPTMAQQELLYLHKVVALRGDDKMAGYATARNTAGTDEAKVEAIKKWAEKRYGVKLPRDPKDYHEYYNPAGEMPSNGTGVPVWKRWDYDAATVEQLTKNKTIYHSTGDPGALLLAWIDNGGNATPTMERARTGVYIGGTGASSDSDIHKGGANYLFANATDRSKALAQQKGFLFKGKNLARIDLRSDQGDSYGKWERASDRRRELDAIAAQTAIGICTNTGLMKNGINVLDELDVLKTGSISARDRTIKELKKRGIDKWPDGRQLADVILA